MPDPTGARMRTLNAFFDSPRVPIKALPEPQDGRDERDDDASHERTRTRRFERERERGQAVRAAR